MWRIAVLLLAATACLAQQNAPCGAQKAQPEPVAAITVPPGTRVLSVLLSPISSASAQTGNGVYLQTATPVVVGNQTVIPPGSYVQGVIDKVVHPGRVKGRAELQIHFTNITFPSGYNQAYAGVLGSAPANESASVGKEGTITENSSHGQDGEVVAVDSATGAIIGAVAAGAKGAGIGAGAGAAAGVVAVLLTRGNDVRLNAGDPVEMVLQRPLMLEHTESQPGSSAPKPPYPGERQQRRRYPVGYPGPVYPPVIYDP